MITLVVIILLLFLGLSYDSYRQHSNNLKRYSTIRHRMRRGIKYPYWRLEEMLSEEQTKKENL